MTSRAPHQRCPLHGLPLTPGGRRFAAVGMFSAPDYFRVEKTRFPRANALRIGACNGRLKGRPSGPYCPGCRDELRGWCLEQLEHDGNSRRLAEGMMRELFSEPPKQPTDDAESES
jgi:hypothetical protein